MILDPGLARIGGHVAIVEVVLTLPHHAHDISQLLPLQGARPPVPRQQSLALRLECGHRDVREQGVLSKAVGGYPLPELEHTPHLLRPLSSAI